VILIKTNIFSPGELALKNVDPELQELIEAEAFYASQVNDKLEEIRKCYDIYPELKEEVESDLNELQEMYNTLKTDLNDNISKKAVIEAMIENNRYRLKMVDQVLVQINC
jgi:N-glycosylase/DNA lyase